MMDSYIRSVGLHHTWHLRYSVEKADIWSCALLAGYLPFQHENLMYLYTKLLKAEFQFPPWFSLESRTLISNILVPDPHIRISISSIMSAPWFLDGFSSTSTCSSPHHQPWENKLASRVHHPLSSSSPKFFNAFEFISTMSSGFDLSGLFEDKRRPSSIFTSKCSPSVILSKIDSMAKDLRFKIEKGKDFQVMFQATAEGRSGRLMVAAEVFEVAGDVAVVEFSKFSGDTLEYEKLWEEQVRPALKDIVWTWQGEYYEEFPKPS
ncbi:CBL-interacting serine/threonine-protein kinase 16 [Stylosanthes scabra]|uniref:non-specific serine/threonine protein kinase n=1 Tax=Stylosanthes scabra TaxID=79078 RepID=A0ABU6Z4V6_9FABA|nr:CBL-interacting serine/threonine-protein kinase 16 [Stylosanthes scabra]